MVHFVFQDRPIRPAQVPRIIEEPRPPRPAHFWWLLANGLAVCFAVLSWTFCLHVFGNPEIPRNYRLLQAMGRAPELKSYTLLDVPNSGQLDPRGLYARFAALADDQLATLDSRLLRNYLSNFSKPLALIYVEGTFEVVETRLLGPGDFISDGFAVRARAMVQPDDFTPAAPYPVLVDLMFSTAESGAIEAFRTGDPLVLRKSPDCAAMIHVDLINDGDETLVGITAIPIVAGPFHFGEHASFALTPPAAVDPGATFPVFRPESEPSNETPNE